MDSRSRKRSGRRPAATLFDAVRDGDRDTFLDRVRNFALEVAKRHGRERSDLNAMLVALRGWHRTWAICSRESVAPLDERSIALAIATYETRAGAARRGSAA